ncbi:MAG: RNA-binding domain-containing protein [Candidatus Thorarchaeota archaeon]
MSFVAKIEARAYSRATEVPDRVIAAVLNLYAEKFQDLVRFESTKVEGQSGDAILIVESKLKDKVGSEATLDYIFGKLNERDRRRLRNSLLSRIDRNCQFFVRIDKQAAFLDDIKLAKGPDVISIQVHIQQYPKCRQENAKTMLEDRLGSAGGDD